MTNKLNSTSFFLSLSFYRCISFALAMYYESGVMLHCAKLGAVFVLFVCRLFNWDKCVINKMNY